MEPILSALVIDRNCWIDLQCGGLVDFALKTLVEPCATDLVLHELKQAPSGEELEAKGVRKLSLAGPQVAELFQLAEAARRVSHQDLSSMIIARDIRGVLVTGDGHLRSLASAQGIDVHGSLWLLRELVTSGLSAATASEAVDSMVAGGSRFPAADVRDLKEWLVEQIE